MIELSIEERLNLLTKWLKYYEIDRIIYQYRFTAIDAIRQNKRLGILLYQPHKPYLSFDEYCKNTHFLNLVSL
jgi:hypothetical protein